MKNLLSSFCLALGVSILLLAWQARPHSDHKIGDSLVGAWEMTLLNGEKPDYKSIRLFSHDYVSSANYQLNAKNFFGTSGGTYTWKDNVYTEHFEFSTMDSSVVGTEFSCKVVKEDDQLQVSGVIEGESFTATFSRIDAGDTPLSGAWRIRERLGRDGEMHEMRPGPRKTIKMLTGTRFQWIAINTETKQFFGTGGGTYTFEEGVYTETIEFFSRDASRVGMSLSFSGKVDGDDWHHSGKSSKGKPINEIWHRQ